MKWVLPIYKTVTKGVVCDALVVAEHTTIETVDVGTIG
jgi:hypothetical protein